MCFTVWNQDLDKQFMFGWWLISLVAFMILINLYFIFKEFMNKIWLVIKKCYNYLKHHFKKSKKLIYENFSIEPKTEVKV